MSVARFVGRVLALVVGGVAALVPGGEATGTGTERGGDLAARRRKPVALAAADGGRWLFVANQASGSVSVVDPGARAVVAEFDVGRSLADLALTPDGRRLLAVDQGSDRLVVLDRDRDGTGTGLRVAARVAVAADPVGLAVASDGSRCAVASRWSRRLTLVGLGGDPRVIGTVELPFGPRRQLVAAGKGGDKLIVADAFGGGLAVVDFTSGAVESVRSLPAHNIGGLAISGDGTRLLMTQQYLNAQADTKADDIHWGFLMTNSVRSLRLGAVLEPGADVVPGGRLDHLGEPGRGAGDPSGIAALPGGAVAVALAGVDEVAVGPLERPDARRVAAGRRPTAVVAGPEGRLVYVAETGDDAVRVVDVGSGSALATIPLGPRPDATEVDLGERLFHDARLSHEGWMSCQSCHTDGHASALLADTLGDGSYGAPKRTLSLLGVADTAPYAWDGHVPTLEEQVAASFRTTLRGKAPDPSQVGAVTAYLRTLAPPPPVVSDPALAPAVARGRAVFERRRCDRCHTPPTYTSASTYDVGLADGAGNTVFNPPSLRGVGQRDRLFHDGRARGLEEVFTRFAHPDDRELPPGDVADLLAFLRSL
jgi:YVTN family beta-propeller protein